MDWHAGQGDGTGGTPGPVPAPAPADDGSCRRPFQSGFARGENRDACAPSAALAVAAEAVSGPGTRGRPGPRPAHRRGHRRRRGADHPGTAGKTHSQVARLAEQAAITVDPDSAAAAAQEAERSRCRVLLFREESGAAGLSGRDLPTDQALAAHARVGERAAEYHDSGAFGEARTDQLRATAYLDLINGTSAASRIAAGQLATQARPGTPASEGPGTKDPWPRSDEPDTAGSSGPGSASSQDLDQAGEAGPGTSDGDDPDAAPGGDPDTADGGGPDGEEPSGGRTPGDCPGGRPSGCRTRRTVIAAAAYRSRTPAGHAARPRATARRGPRPRPARPRTVPRPGRRRHRQPMDPAVRHRHRHRRHRDRPRLRPPGTTPGRPGPLREQRKTRAARPGAAHDHRQPAERTGRGRRPARLRPA